MENTRSQPILLIGAGPGAVATLSRLPHAGKTLCVHVGGPFGLIVAKKPGGRVHTSNCFWLSEIHVPEANGAGGCPADFDGALFSEVCSLVRRLQAGGQEAAGNRSRVRIHAYVVIDLAAAGAVPFVVKLIQLVRRADPAIEMTGLVLTERTVETGTSETSAWYEAFEQLAAGAETMHLLQRLYVLDGEDTNRTWLRNPEEMHRIGAEFILHHGVSPYRHHLRRREKTRVSLKEGFLEFCGSLMCKRFRWDPSTVAREIAAVVANDAAPQESEQGVLSQERSAALDRLVQRLVTEISAAYQREDVPSGAPAQDAPSSPMSPEGRVHAALEETLKEVCAETPGLSLRWFLSRLRLRLDQLTRFSKLRARWDSRYRVARLLQKQMRDTYAPMKRWREHEEVQWQTPFRPFFKEAPSAVLSQPIPVESYFTAIAVAAAGLALVALGEWLGRPVLTVGGGIVTIWSSLVTATTTRWIRRRRVVILQDQRDAGAVPNTYYQARASMAQLAFSALFLLGALGCLAWSLDNSRHVAVGFVAVMSGGLALACSLAGAVLIYLSGVRMRRPRGVPDDKLVPDLAPPRDRRWFITGLVLLTIAWGALRQTWGSLDVTFDMAVLGGGLASAWIALLIAQFPRSGSARLACTDLRKPAPLAPLEAQSVEVPQLAAEVSCLRSWADRLMSASGSLDAGGLNWNQAALEDPLPKMFSPHWQSQLAAIFRKELESQTGKTLDELMADPANWARCLLEGLSDPNLELSNPLHIFCLYYVKRWLREKPLERVISQLTVDRGMLISAVRASAPPRWPQTRDDPEIDTSVIAVGRELWDMIAPFTDADDPHRFALIDWQQPYTVAVVRTVQGLSRGWQGYPGLPGRSRSTDDSEETPSLAPTSNLPADARLHNVPVRDAQGIPT